MQMEKAEIIVTARKAYHAIGGKDREWWQKSERGKSWELWMMDKDEMLRFLTRIPTSRALWVIPFKEDEKDAGGLLEKGANNGWYSQEIP